MAPLCSKCLWHRFYPTLSPHPCSIASIFFAPFCSDCFLSKRVPWQVGKTIFNLTIWDRGLNLQSQGLRSWSQFSISRSEIVVSIFNLKVWDRGLNFQSRGLRSWSQFSISRSEIVVSIFDLEIEYLRKNTVFIQSQGLRSWSQFSISRFEIVVSFFNLKIWDRGLNFQSRDLRS